MWKNLAALGSGIVFTALSAVAAAINGAAPSAVVGGDIVHVALFTAAAALAVRGVNALMSKIGAKPVAAA